VVAEVCSRLILEVDLRALLLRAQLHPVQQAADFAP